MEFEERVEEALLSEDWSKKTEDQLPAFGETSIDIFAFLIYAGDHQAEVFIITDYLDSLSFH